MRYLILYRVLIERRLMAFLVKYILIILLRVDIQGIIMLRREEMKEVYSG